eukprot:TRINITY_DN22642_c0_g1_i2.p2 TRINITY_DN22642_c0_g1~~TRINITY_DN22642_c0_g1_i2.p2  ORF type:complete len:113 (-),score=3.19 TRINITY_DN22642_c0_g1_i2:60-398(-)
MDHGILHRDMAHSMDQGPFIKENLRTAVLDIQIIVSMSRRDQAGGIALESATNPLDIPLQDQLILPKHLLPTPLPMPPLATLSLRTSTAMKKLRRHMVESKLDTTLRQSSMN